EDIRKLNIENERLKMELQLKEKKDEEIEYLKQYQKDNLQFNSAQVYYYYYYYYYFLFSKITFVEMEKLKKDIESKNNEIQKIKQEMQVKQKQIMEQQKNFEEKNKQMNENKEEKKENIMNNNSSTSIINIAFNYNFELVRSFKLINTFTGHTDWVRSIDYSIFDDCQFICSGSDDKTVRVWDIDNNKQIQSFNGHSDSVYCVKFSSYHYHNNRQNVICSSSDDNTICFWDVKDNQQLQLFNEHTEGVWGIEISPFNGGRYLVSGSYDSTIRLWDIETSKSLHVFKGHTEGIWCVDFSPLQSDNKSNSIGMIGGNGYTICSGSLDNTIRIWDIEKTKQLTVFKGHEDSVRSTKYGPNESGSDIANTILSGSLDKSVRLWDIRSGKQTQVFDGHTSDVSAVAYSQLVLHNLFNWFKSRPNIICSASKDNTIRFWDVRSNKRELYAIKGEEEKDNGISLEALFIFGNNKNETTFGEFLFTKDPKKEDNILINCN
ncbi:hypothetical protein RFI_04999, partial [Reticulomyxa filosa]